MYSVLAVDDMKEYLDRLKYMDFWRKHPEFILKYVAADSVEALDILKNNHIDIFITDIKMPKLSGFELLAYVKNQRLCPCTILLSEHAEFEYARKAMALGAFDFIPKPVTEESLENVMSRAKDTIEKVHSAHKNGISQDMEIKITSILVQDIISGEEGFESRVGSLLHLSQELSLGDLSYNRVILSEVCQQIFDQVSETYPWIINIVPSMDKIRNQILQENEIVISQGILKNFLRELFIASKTFHPPGINGLTEKIIDHILNNISRKLTLTEVSSACYVNKSYLSHIFKQNMGISFVTYIVNYKMQSLKVMINESDMKLQEMAEKLGYDDYKYMGRLFKDVYGMSPSDYKKSLQDSSIINRDNEIEVTENSQTHNDSENFCTIDAHEFKSTVSIVLSIVKDVVEKHGVNVMVKSQSDKGCTIIMTLPKV